jgi:hypothetical protein
MRDIFRWERHVEELFLVCFRHCRALSIDVLRVSLLFLFFLCS